MQAERHRPLGVDAACSPTASTSAAGVRCELPDVRIVVTAQDRLPPLDEQAVLLLDDGGIARQRLSNLEVLPFDDALRTGDLAKDDGVLDRLVATFRREAAGMSASMP